MYLNAYFCWHICTCSICIAVSFICWCITNHILKLRQLEWPKAITLTLLMNLQFGQVLAGTICFCHTGVAQKLGARIIWSFIHLHFRCLGLEPQTAGAPSLAIFLWSSRGIFPAWSTQDSCTSSLYPRATRSVGKRRKEKREKERKHSRGKQYSSLLLSLSSHAASLPLSVCWAGP